VRFVGAHPPVVVTDSAGTFWYWTAARGFSERSVWRKLRRERRVASLLGYIHPTTRPDAATQALYFVASGKRLAAQLGIDPSRIGGAPAGVPAARTAAPLRMQPPTLLFVARNFEIKGGPDALTTLQRVRADFPECRLLVAGSDRPDPGIDGVEWLGPMTRDRLYADVYPRADIFLYPTRFDVAPLVVAEALGHGVPVVGPDAFGLPDLVESGQTGVLVAPGRPDLLSAAVIELLANPERLRALGQAAAADFSARLSVEVRNRALRAAYDNAAASPLRRPGKAAKAVD
jgi:glycosyltransferase involved in cell wall biosynthesis